MDNTCLRCPVRESTICGALGLDRIDILESYKKGNRKFTAGSPLYHEGDNCNNMFIVLEGWVSTTRNLVNGKRLILNFQLPGAFMGFQSTPFAPMQHSAVCLTDVRVCVFPRIGFNSLLLNNPALALALSHRKAKDEENMQSNFINIATRPARARLAYFLLSLRSQVIKTYTLANNADLYLPINQKDIADTLGLTNVHVSRAIGTLQKDKLLTFKKHRLAIHDVDRLSEIAEMSISPSTT